MKHFIDRAEHLMKMYEQDKKVTVALARELRNELGVEYKNNDLQRIRKAYIDHELFSRNYKPGIADAYVSTVGQLTQSNVYSFLYDVKDYMLFHFPSKYKKEINQGAH